MYFRLPVAVGMRGISGVPEAFHRAKQRYGAPRLTGEIHAQGYRFNVKTVAANLWSQSVIGWSRSSRMTTQLACDALHMALWRRKRPENVIVHTDRGG